MLGAVMGLLFGLFVAIDLVLLGIVAFDSVAITVLVVLGLLAGVALGVTAPFGARDDGNPPTVAPGAAVE